MRFRGLRHGRGSGGPFGRISRKFGLDTPAVAHPPSSEHRSVVPTVPVADQSLFLLAHSPLLFAPYTGPASANLRRANSWIESPNHVTCRRDSHENSRHLTNNGQVLRKRCWSRHSFTSSYTAASIPLQPRIFSRLWMVIQAPNTSHRT